MYFYLWENSNTASFFIGSHHEARCIPCFFGAQHFDFQTMDDAKQILYINGPWIHQCSGYFVIVLWLSHRHIHTNIQTHIYMRWFFFAFCDIFCKRKKRKREKHIDIYKHKEWIKYFWACMNKVFVAHLIHSREHGLRFALHGRWWRIIALGRKILFDWRWLIAENVMHQFDFLPLAIRELNQFIFAHLGRSIGGQYHVQYIWTNAQHFAATEKVFGKQGPNSTADRATDYQQRGVVQPNTVLSVLRR